MSSVEKVYMDNSLRRALYKLSTHLSTAIVDKSDAAIGVRATRAAVRGRAENFALPTRRRMNSRAGTARIGDCAQFVKTLTCDDDMRCNATLPERECTC